MVYTLFKKALKSMLEDGEFPKIITNCKTKKERKDAESDYFLISTISKDFDIEEYPVLVIMNELKSPSVWADALCYMKHIQEIMLRKE